ncbi:diguanylate cyclase (GGDEF)-like protein [Methylorubrum rhodinum]|uniref:Diguanylate cyclase (GGDEF)-like protein n=1 Tax=Methylorubrum rhodinum TaxID=29428 RepID=A0A840ZN73_9HYPH|nr:EAL domain-containing protein [Methylorubrum rhodinum]MBB5758505.1 diguanylate cyclase (GGDEF)-like protein [Methylorubrum rhodinum]
MSALDTPSRKAGKARSGFATAGRGAPGPEDARLRHETRAAMLGETLQLAKYSAVTQAAVALALAYMFRDIAPHGYMAGLATAVILLCAATLTAARRYRHALGAAATERAIRRGFAASKLLALVLGLSWASMPAVLLPGMDNAYRVIVVAVCAGLVSDAYVVGPIFGVAVLLAAPVVAGLFVGLLGCEAPVGDYIAVLLAVYATFVFFSARRMCGLSYQRLWDRAVVQQQSETIGLLLKDFEEGTSDWLWETDAAGRLHHSRRRFAALFGRDAADLRDLDVMAVLRAIAAEGAARGDIEAVIAAVQARLPFRDLTVSLATTEGTRWWTLNGKPAFDRQGAFLGYRGVGSDVTASRAAQARIAFLAGHDALTGLPNRTNFQEVLEEVCREIHSSERRSALFYLDLDGFKVVNDTRGHLVGDRLLKEVAARLLDVCGSHGVFRLGGDEFAVVVRDTGRAEAEALASRAVAALRRPYPIDETRLEIGVSVGIAYGPDDAIDPSSLLMRADLALYAAKADGKGCWRTFDPALEEKVQRHRQLDVDMRAALAADEMELHYQPLVDMRSGRVTGFEALLRWNKPGQGWVSPGEVIPVAEGTGFVVEIGRWALRRACTDALAWDGLRVAVNISSIHLRMPGFHEEVAAVLRETGLRPDLLEVEITESVLLDHGVEVLDNLNSLRALGVRIALDDFGTGYSSLSYLTEFPFDKVKVDRSFVRDLQGRPEKVAVVEAIARMGRALSMNVTVEGVETRQQLDVLREKRCDVAQGFLYSPARPASEVMALIGRIEGTVTVAPAAESGPAQDARPILSLVRAS